MKRAELPELDPPMQPISAADALARALYLLDVLSGENAFLAADGSKHGARVVIEECKKARELIRALYIAQRGY
jgi:hypothetical protein